jgi:hypothetical protein
MTFSKSEQKVIQKIFRKAYFNKDAVPSGDRWQPEVMRRIRNLGPIQSRKSIWIPLEQLFWRLAPAVCLMIIILTTLLYRMEIVPDTIVFQVLINAEEELTLSQLVGV